MTKILIIHVMQGSICTKHYHISHTQSLLVRMVKDVLWQDRFAGQFANECDHFDQSRTSI